MAVILVLAVIAALIIAVFVAALFLTWRKAVKLSAQDILGMHVLITGGSKGIGRAVAEEFVKMGAHVTIVARDKTALLKTHKELCEIRSSDAQKIQWFSVDLTGLYDSVKNVLEDAERDAGKAVDILVNNAGGSVQSTFETLGVDSFEAQMRLNYLSAVYISRAWVERVKLTPGQKRIVFVSSAAGLVGLFGYSAYCPAKFALRGFAESLQAELKPFGIAVTVAFPPNTDTEGFKEELKTMPRETELISGAAGLWTPTDVAKIIVKDVLRGKFLCPIGTDVWLLANLCAGMSPASSLCDVVLQTWLLGVFRLVGLYTLTTFDKIIENCKKEREKAKQD